MVNLPQVYSEVHFERIRQDEQWGGPDHDDKIPWFDWLDRIAKQVRNVADAVHEGRATPTDPPAEFRDVMLKIAAIAVASVESRDRLRRS